MPYMDDYFEHINYLTLIKNIVEFLDEMDCLIYDVTFQHKDTNIDSLIESR